MRPAITQRQKQIRTELPLEDVFDAIWLVIGRRKRLLPPGEQAKLRLSLAKLLVELEASGVTDPKELKRRATEELFLTVPQRDADLLTR